MVDKLANYEQFVVVAETEWKFDYENSEMDPKSPTKPRSLKKGTTTNNIEWISSAIHSIFKKKRSPANANAHEANLRIVQHSLRMGTIEWNIVFDAQTGALEFNISCQTVAEGVVDEVHMELIPYRRLSSCKNYEKQNYIRHTFTRADNILSGILVSRAYLLTIRILKPRAMFPNFTLENTAFVGRLASNGKLRVGDQLFHVNKQMLSMHSDHFDQMFNGAYKEARQEVIELKLEPAHQAVFHNFLLVMCVPEVLPNPDNVVALSYLADIYQVCSVRDKCQLHLWTCREMPVEQRYLLALENGNKELQSYILRNVVNLEESERIIAAVSEKAIAL